MGYRKKDLCPDEKQGLSALIEDHREVPVPLAMPLKHHLNCYPVPDWVHQQVYLNPYPKELTLPNHV
jgi:uncharacterized protein YbgA (DUF1722 family)